MPPQDGTLKLVERAFWWLVGIFGTLFCAAATAVVTVLWTMNTSIATLNERVGAVIEKGRTFEERLSNYDYRLRRVEDSSREKARR